MLREANPIDGFAGSSLVTQKGEVKMAGYQMSAKARSTHKLTGLICLVISIPLLIWGWNATMDDEWYSKLVLFFGLVGAYVAVSLLLSKFTIIVDENGVAEKGHIFPWDNWTLTWEDATGAQVLSSGIKLLWQKKVRNATAKGSRDISSSFDDFEKIIAEIKEHLEKAGKAVTQDKSSK
jgi:hypothetical protein